MKVSYLKGMFDDNGGQPIMLKNKRSGKRYLVYCDVFEAGIQGSKHSDDDSYVYADGHRDCQPDWEPSTIKAYKSGPKATWFWISNMEICE